MQRLESSLMVVCSNFYQKFMWYIFSKPAHNEIIVPAIFFYKNGLASQISIKGLLYDLEVLQLKIC